MDLPSEKSDPASLALIMAFGIDGSDAVSPRPVSPADDPHATDESSFPCVVGYHITGRLGEGGMGTVWRAEQLGTHRPIALKLLGSAGLGSSRARARFEREIELASRLEHPNIARVYESGVHRGLCYYAMELIQGVRLDHYVQQRDLGSRAILELYCVVCDAVRHAHQRGVIHRDLKPSNVLVDTRGHPHVVDFGLAKLTADEPQTTGMLDPVQA